MVLSCYWKVKKFLSQGFLIIFFFPKKAHTDVQNIYICPYKWLTNRKPSFFSSSLSEEEVWSIKQVFLLEILPMMY